MTGNLSDFKQGPQSKFRLAFYGAAKLQKTTIAGMFAELGYNCIFCQFDEGGTQVLPKRLSAKAQERIYVMNMGPQLDKFEGAALFARMCKGEAMLIDNVTQSTTLGQLADKTHPHIWINPKLLTQDDIIITDSYTKLVAALTARVAAENGIDLFKIGKTKEGKPDWDFYGFEGRWLNAMLEQLAAFPCNIIVIGHETDDVKRAKDPNDPTGKTEIIVSTKKTMKSSSNPHSTLIAASMGDVCYFYQGLQDIMVSVQAKAGQVGGGRNLPSKEWTIGAFTPAMICAELGVKPSGKAPAPEAITYFAPGEVTSARMAPLSAAVKSPDQGMMGMVPGGAMAMR